MSSHIFYSPSLGQLRFYEVITRIVSYIEADKIKRYAVVIGTDSQKQKNVDFVTALIVHRIGKGGIYFWSRNHEKGIKSLRQRIYYEATLSLDLAQKLLGEFKKNGLKYYNLEIHVDIGEVGPTREMIKEVVSMIRGNGFEVKTKPESWGASGVAHRHT